MVGASTGGHLARGSTAFALRGCEIGAEVAKADACVRCWNGGQSAQFCAAIFPYFRIFWAKRSLSKSKCVSACQLLICVNMRNLALHYYPFSIKIAHQQCSRVVGVVANWIVWIEFCSHLHRGRFGRKDKTF